MLVGYPILIYPNTNIIIVIIILIHNTKLIIFELLVLGSW